MIGIYSLIILKRIILVRNKSDRILGFFNVIKIVLVRKSSIIIEILIIFSHLKIVSDVRQMLIESLWIHFKFVLVILLDCSNCIWFESTIDIDSVFVKNVLFHLVENQGMDGSDPVFSQNFNLFNLFITFLYEKKHK